MPLNPLSQAYRVAPRARAAAWAPPQQPPVGRDSRRERSDDDSDTDTEADCDSVRRSPLLHALLRALGLAGTTAQDAIVERALIVFARALNLASGDADAAPQPVPARAGDAAQRRARHEEQLLVAFAELLHAAGYPGVATREALQDRLGAFLQALARELRVDDDRTGEATQPGSLISVRA